MVPNVSLESVKKFFPFTRKTILNVLLLTGMGLSLVFLSKPYGSAAFAFGGVFLSTDYKILKTLRLNDQYHWIQNENTSAEAQRQYKRKQFIERGPDRVELKPMGNGDFRGVLTQASECVYEGLTFRIYVKASLDKKETVKKSNSDQVTHYDLRLGTVEITRISESDEGRILFLSITGWNENYEDQQEEHLVKEVRERLEIEDDSDEPFAKVIDEGKVNEFDIDEWRAIADWAEDQSL